MRAIGDLVKFTSGATVVLLEPSSRCTWRVMFVRGDKEHARGFITYMSDVLLDRGRPLHV